MKGPQLTPRKIEKLRDALRAVAECDQVQDRVLTKMRLAEAALAVGDLERLLAVRKP